MKPDFIQKELFFYTPHNEPVREDVIYHRSAVAGVLINGTLYSGIARCSKKDQFIKIKGRTIAKSRAILEPVKSIKLENPDKLTETFIENAKSLL